MPSSIASLARFGSLGVGVAGLIASVAVHADPLTVSNAQTTAATTAAASNASPGDITVNSGGSIIVADTGPAVTVNSSNNLTNNGTIQSSAATGATAILVNGSGNITTTIANNGAAGVTGTGGSGNYGIRVLGGSVTGSISSTSAGSVTANGDSSYGVSIEAPFTGNVSINGLTVAGSNAFGVSVTAPLTGSLTLTGASSVIGANATGVLVAAPVSGTVSNNGAMAGGQSATTGTASDGTVTSVPSVVDIAGYHIAASLGRGFVNNRFFVDSSGAVVADAAALSTDTLVLGQITGIAGTTGVLVAPLAPGSGNVILSAVGGVGSDDGYGFVNRGSISSAGSLAGTTATAIRIAGASASGLSSNVIVDQGLINQAHGVITANTTEATATAISIGAGASVPAIVNRGAIGADSGIVSAGAAAAAYAIDIGPGAQVSNITNSGSIGAEVAGNGGTATAIRDQSGSVSSITNSGTISANADTARAIDLSAGTGAQTVSNSGSITGDIVFGSGNATYAATAGSLDGTLAFGRGANLLSLDGTAAIASPVTVAGGGSLAVTLRGTSRLNLGASPPVLASLAASGQSQLAVPVAAGSGLMITGAASFTDQSSVRLIIAQQIGTAPVTVLTAGGGITTDHLSTLISGTSTPFLYTLDGYSIDGGALQVTLHQKTGTEAGFSPGTAPLFDQSLVAFGNGATFQAIANLPDQASLFAAYRQIAPPGFGTLPIRLAQDLQSAGGGVIRGRLDALAANPPGSTPDDGMVSPWIEENVSLLRHGDTPDDPGFRSNSFDVSLGADYPLTRTLAVGAAGTFAWNDIHIDGMTEVENKPFSVDSLMADVYAGWHKGPFFAQLVGGYAHNHYDFHRQIAIGSVSAAQTARWNGYQVSGDVVGGMRFKVGRFTVEPSDALSYIKVHQSGYTTTGGGDLDLAVNGRSDTATLNTARLALGYRLPLGDEANLDLGLHAGYVVNFDKHLDPLTAQFTAGGSPFEMSTVAYRANAFQEGGSVAYQMPGFYLGLTGDRQQESGFSDTSLALTLRTAF